MEIKNTEKVQNNTSQIVCKKHIVAYLLPSFILLFGLIITAFSLGKGLSFYVGLLLIVWSIYRIIKLKNIRWVYSGQKLYLESGVFKWQKASFQIPLEDIYEIYYFKNLVSSMLGFKNIMLRRTDGITSTFAETKMDNVQEMVNVINADLEGLKQAKNKPTNQVFNTVILSVGDELKKLQELHLQGYLTDEEFKQQKQKVLAHH